MGLHRVYPVEGPLPLDPLGSLSALSPLVGLESNTIADTVAGPSGTAGPSWLTGKLAQGAVIVLGLLLVAAGLFSFQKTREILVSGAKTAGAVAA